MANTEQHTTPYTVATMGHYTIDHNYFINSSKLICREVTFVSGDVEKTKYKRTMIQADLSNINN